MTEIKVLIMKKIIKSFGSIFIFLLVIGIVKTQAQSKATIQNIDFHAEGSNLVITYDIVKAEPGEKFETWVKVQTGSGQEIIPHSVTGDVGLGVSGGPNKRIVWDVSADNVKLDDEISVEVFARSNLKSGGKSTNKTKGHRQGISPGGAMALSALLPGLGSTVAVRGGAQWLWGIVGYGCIAGSIAMNGIAYDSYEDYKGAITANDRDDLFTKSKNHDLYSKIFAGSAAVIWVAEIISSGVKAAKYRSRQSNSKFSMDYRFDPLSGKPLIGFNYKF